MKKTNLTPVVYAALYLNKKTPAEKVSYGNYLFLNISGNLDLTTPVPTLVSYQTTFMSLNNAITAALSGSVIDKQALDAAESAFDIQTRRLADYVQNTANAFAPSIATSIILSAGMLTRKSPEKALVPVAVSKLTASFTNAPGTILTKWKGVKYARTYLVYYSLSNDLAGNWTVASATPNRTLEIQGLTSGTRYYIKIVAVGIHGSVPATTLATCIAS